MVRLKGSTIIESLLAMSILMIITAITILLIGMLIKGPNNIYKWRAQIVVQRIAQETKEKENYQNEIIDSFEFNIHREITPYPNTKKLFHLSITAYDTGKVILAKHEEVIKIK